MTFRILLIVAICSIVTHSAAAQATPTRRSSEAGSPSDAEMERARAHFTAGQTAVEQELFGEAYAQFTAGYSLSRRPLFLFNMAECARENGRVGTARTDYQRYLAAEPNGSMSEVTQARLRELPSHEPPTPEVEVSATPDISPAHAAASAEPDALTIPEPNNRPESRRPLRRKWQFWTVVSAVVLAAGAAVVIGVAASGTSSPQCDGGCELVDVR